MSPVIRRAEPEDRSRVEAIVEAAYTMYIPRMGRKPGPMLDDYAASIAAGQVHVLEAEASVVGLVVLVPQGTAMLLDNVAVDPAVKGRGFGHALIAFAEASARKAGYDAMTLYTHETMVENIGLYGRIGFVETHRAEEKGLRRVYMMKRLRVTATGSEGSAE